MDAEGASEDLGGHGSHDEQKIPVYRLSCDNCRQRKVRCSRTYPCDPCSRKQFPCTYPAGYKPRAKRKQVRVSLGYEEKLDEISRKIDRICLTVDKLGPLPPNAGARLVCSPTVGESVSTEATSRSYTAPCINETHESDGGSSSDLGEDVALAVQADFATELAERLVDNAHPLDDLPEVKSSLSALKNSISATKDRHKRWLAAGAGPASPTPYVEGTQLPPMQASMTALQRLRESARLKLFWCMEFDNIGQFVEYFMTVYSGKPSLAATIIVYCGLHRLFVECANSENDMSLRREFHAHGALCRENLSSLLRNVPFNPPVTFDFALALYMMSTYYLEACKVSKAWNSLVVACQMCQSLGYNRENLPGETNQSKKRRVKLFWCIYMLDKMVALRLNRPSSLRDDDIMIRVQSPPTASISADEPLTLFPAWVELVMLHGKIYDDIYSLGALSKPVDVRDARARSIANDLQRIFTSSSPMEEYLIQTDRHSIGDTVCDLMIRAERISQLATLTLVYRGIHPALDARSAFCPECLHTANQCLEEHRVCLAILKDVELSVLELYVQWALLSAPFVPFIVIFCHVIETRDQTHLDKLSAVVETLQLLPLSLPDVYRKQHRLFKLMYDVACKYINSPTNTPSESTVPRATDMPFEMFYSEAGLPLPGRLHEQTNAVTQGNGQESMAFPDYGAELGNWFDQNHQIFKMLEDTV